MSSSKPDLELENVLKRYYNKVEYFQGGMMNSRNLERVCVRDAEAVNKYFAIIILTNKSRGSYDFMAL